jgi:hypothetical protein
MWGIVLNFLGGPIVNGLLAGYTAKLKSDDSIDQTKARLAAQAIALDTREAELASQERIALMGHWWACENLFGYVTLVYYGKVLIWDAALHLGSTDKVGGAVSQWAALVVAFYFGSRSLVNALAIWKSK